MRFLVEIEGTAYSRHKEAFKRLLAKHGLRWKGTLDRPLWAGAAERVTAEFERDEGRDILLRAVLRWDGRLKSKLLEDLKAWAWEVGGRVSEDPGPNLEEASDDIEQALRLWDMIYKPNEEWLRGQGRPASWIEEDVRRWKRLRQEGGPGRRGGFSG